MFKKFFKGNAAFGVNFIAFIVSVSLVIFAVSCGGDSGTNSNGGGNSSGSGSYTEPEKPDPSYNVTKSVTIALQGNKDEWLTIDALIQMNPADPEKAEAGFDYVNVLLNGAVIDSLSKQKPGMIHDAIVSGAKSILLSDATCGQKVEVCIVGYYNNKSNNESECASEVRAASKCASSSSVAPSSSATMTVKQFEQVTFSGAQQCTITGSKGLTLDGTCGTATTASDVYCPAAGCADLAVGSTFEMMFEFLNVENGRCWDIWPSGPTGIENPTTSTQFIPCDEYCYDIGICNMLGDIEQTFEFTSGPYYLVRKKNSGNEWNTNWYLVRGTNNVPQGGIDMKVWRVK